MNNKLLSLLFILLISPCLDAISASDQLVVLQQVAGIIKTNCYLIYDSGSKEAALIDVGGPIDTLEAAITEKDLSLKYIFFTHGHYDHIQGLPEIRSKYPHAKLCLTKSEYEDMPLYAMWESAYSPQERTEIKRNPELVKTFNFDYRLIGKPDIFVEDGNIYQLGNFEIRTYLSPGHSRGSICFHIENVLFSGDVLFYRSVGRVFDLTAGSQQKLIESVRRLYQSLSDETMVYPGHGPSTGIGSEKIKNTKITIDKVYF